MASKSSDGVVILLNREILREGEECEAARGVAVMLVWMLDIIAVVVLVVVF